MRLEEKMSDSGSDREMPPEDMGGMPNDDYGDYASSSGYDDGDYAGGNQDFDDDFEDNEDPMEPDASQLPEGVKKEVLKEASEPRPGDAPPRRQPMRGDRVQVHYTGSLESDGTVFDASRNRGEDPFEFTLGHGLVISGWDMAVATMRIGETAKITIAPEYAYGEAGSGDKIPPNATLCFEVELLGFKGKDDLFEDLGVIKSVVAPGSGPEKPKNAGVEVLLGYKISLFGAPDIAVLDGNPEVEYAVGFGSNEKAGIGGLRHGYAVLDRVLPQMKRGEVVRLQLSPEYAYGPDGDTAKDVPAGAYVSLELELKEIYRVDDCSFERDGSVMKKTIRQAQGWACPRPNARCTLTLIAATAGEENTELFPAGKTEEIVAVAGDGDVFDALDMALVSMKKQERAVLTISEPSLCRRGLKKIELLPEEALAAATAPIRLTVGLLNFEDAKEDWDMSKEEKVEAAEVAKAKGAELFKAQRTLLAQRKYQAVVSMFGYLDDWNGEYEELKKKAVELKKLCQLNLALLALNRKDYVQVKNLCGEVLETDSLNTKALYRRAAALIGLKDYAAAMASCKRILDVEQTNKDARALYQKAQQLQKEEDKKQKGLFANMCKGLGKLGGDKRTEAEKENMQKNSGGGNFDDDGYDSFDSEEEFQQPGQDDGYDGFSNPVEENIPEPAPAVTEADASPTPVAAN